MYPVVLTNAAWINYMGPIVFRVRNHKIGVRHGIVAVAGLCFPGWRNPSRLLHRSESGFG